MNTAVVYKSKYGSTKKYAEWIAEDLGCRLFESTEVRPDELDAYDLVIYGGGLYAGSIPGVKQITGNFKKQLVVFAVGMSVPEENETDAIAKRNLTDEARGRTKMFQFRGGYDLEKFTTIHKLVMLAVRKGMKSKPGISPEEKAALSSEKADFTDREAIKPLIDYVKGMTERE